MKRFVLYTLLLSLPAAHAALIVNGGFESPVAATGTATPYNIGDNLSGWTVTGDTGGQVYLLNNGYFDIGGNYGAQEGVQHLDLTGPGLTNRAGVSQLVSTLAGSTYSLSFFIGDINNAVLPYTASVEVLLNGLSAGNFSVTAPAGGAATTWQQFTLNFVATGATTITFLRMPDGTPGPDQYIGLDNVALAEVTPGSDVPEPASLLLSAAGLGLLALRRRNAR